MSKPYIIAKVQLSAEVLSFHDGPDPRLTVSFTLISAKSPITLERRSLPSIYETIAIHDITSNKRIVFDIIPGDVCFRSGIPPLRLVPKSANKFRTLEPGVSCEVTNIPFRPRGSRRCGNRDQGAESSKAKYQFFSVGMHLLEPGHEYTVAVQEGLHVNHCMEGRLEEFMQAGPEWRPHSCDIEVIPAESFRFRVEEENLEDELAN